MRIFFINVKLEYQFLKIYYSWNNELMIKSGKVLRILYNSNRLMRTNRNRQLLITNLMFKC